MSCLGIEESTVLQEDKGDEAHVFESARYQGNFSLALRPQPARDFNKP